jgi:hypothetical protein
MHQRVFLLIAHLFALYVLMWIIVLQHLQCS